MTPQEEVNNNIEQKIRARIKESLQKMEDTSNEKHTDLFAHNEKMISLLSLYNEITVLYWALDDGNIPVEIAEKIASQMQGMEMRG